MRFTYTRRTATSVHFVGFLGQVDWPCGAVILYTADTQELIRFLEPSHEYRLLRNYFTKLVALPWELVSVELCAYANAEIGSFTIVDADMRIRLHVHPERDRRAYRALMTVLEAGIRRS